MSNDNLMLLFTAGIFLIALLTFIVLLIEKISKK
ncbi:MULTISPECIES: putative holin-like toxin [Clostridium]|uniref:Holin-like toxin n=1 Tax=Clostridium neuense TaxID=1728934 RepID=A0ABW8TEZ9_9CLOT|nr:putative holin-like toxin [Clostridium guangxiense]MCD2348346.1 putative holin-like toxin [Clostridium guangxiense]